MSVDTTAVNKLMTRFDHHRDVWLFGYSSLIYKVDFPFMERRPATIDGWTRRFWQGSHDHRGTSASPGRVATLVAHAGAVCAGMAYRITPQVIDHLDYREKNGYLRFCTRIDFDDGNSVEGLVYIATGDNAAYLGPASEQDIAVQIAAAVGPSGRNSEYLMELAQALRQMGKADPHVFTIERHLLEIAGTR
jgi:cation transport protein ChaC